MKSPLNNLSLRYKFLGVTVLLVFAAVTVHLVMAVRLFNDDKQPFVYEGIASLVDSLAENTATSVRDAAKTLTLFTATYNQVYSSLAARDRALESIFAADDELVDIALFKAGAAKAGAGAVADLHLTKKAYFEPYKLDKAYMTKVMTQRPVPFDLAEKEPLILQNASLKNGVVLLRMTMAIDVDVGGSGGKERQIIVAHLAQDRRVRLFKRSELYTTFLIDRYGNYLIHPVVEKVLKGETMENQTWLAAIRKAPGGQQVKELEDQKGQAHIVAFTKVPLGDLWVVSQVPRATAFAGTTKLEMKSLYVALQIVFASIIVSLVFTRRLTGSLRRLYQATKRVAEGNFDINLAVKSGDEIGALSFSFNRMGKEIARLLTETADKARMEKELETAHLVQDNFFPVSEVKAGDFDIAAFFKSATECGGDWWGHFLTSDKLVILVGDATGHGAPSALITAATYSCAVTIEQMIKILPSDQLSASSLMQVLNTAVYSAGKGKIKMTFFVGIIDLQTGTMRYANASHESPLICRTPADRPYESERSRSDLTTVTSRPDPCLGAAIDSEFVEYSIEIGAGDSIVWYTDGITEARNKEEKEFGESRLCRAFAKVATLPPPEVRQTLIDKVLEFCSDRPLDDDFTLVVLKRDVAASGAIVLPLSA